MFFNLKVDRTEWDVGRNGEWSERGGTKGTGGREREGKPRVEDRKQSSAARLTTERL